MPETVPPEQVTAQRGGVGSPLHRRLIQQLRRLGLDTSHAPTLPQWQALVAEVSAAYARGGPPSDPADDRRASLVSNSPAPPSPDTQADIRLQALVQALPDLVLLFDGDGRCLDVLPQPGSAEGGSATLPVAAIKERLINAAGDSGKPPCALLPSIRAALATNTLQVAECSLVPSPDDRVFEARVIPTGLKPDGQRTVVVLARDITASMRLRRQLEHAANQDALTGLPNRRLLDERLAGLAERAGRTGTHAAVLLLDLDRFKQINDRNGHVLGDRLLQAVADRLQSVIRRQDLVARFGGDEFVLVLEGLQTPRDATMIAQQIRDTFATPFVLPATEPDGVVEVKITASIGVAVFPDDGDTAESLLRHADAGMYAGKEP